MKLLKSTPTSATDENVLVAQKYIYQAYVHSCPERERERDGLVTIYQIQN